jgi:hypothetical protein
MLSEAPGPRLLLLRRNAQHKALGLQRKIVESSFTASSSDVWYAIPQNITAYSSDGLYAPGDAPFAGLTGAASMMELG